MLFFGFYSFKPILVIADQLLFRCCLIGMTWSISCFVVSRVTCVELLAHHCPCWSWSRRKRNTPSTPVASPHCCYYEQLSSEATSLRLRYQLKVLTLPCSIFGSSLSYPRFDSTLAMTHFESVWLQQWSIRVCLVHAWSFDSSLISWLSSFEHLVFAESVL